MKRNNRKPVMAVISYKLVMHKSLLAVLANRRTTAKNFNTVYGGLLAVEVILTGANPNIAQALKVIARTKGDVK